MSLSDRLVAYLKAVGHPVASGTLQKLAVEKAGQTGRTCVRRLQELQEEGVLEVEYREKNHAWYSYKGDKSKPEKVYYVRHPFTGKAITLEEYKSL